MCSILNSARFDERRFPDLSTSHMHGATVRDVKEMLVKLFVLKSRRSFHRISSGRGREGGRVPLYEIKQIIVSISPL